MIRRYFPLSDIMDAIEQNVSLYNMMESGRLSIHVQDELYPYFIDGRYRSYHSGNSTSRMSLRYVFFVHGDIFCYGYRSLKHKRGFLLLDDCYFDVSKYVSELPF